MSLFQSILVPLDGSRTAAKSLGCATWLAARLGAKLHILSASQQVLAAREALARLQVPEEYWSLIMLHQAPAYPEQAILDAVSRHGVQLLVMTARGEAAESPGPQVESDPLRIVGHVTRTVIEATDVPVLLLPLAYQESLPWTSALVPASGEPTADEALAVAVDLANALELKVHVAHVTDGEDAGAALGRYSDAPHHEYPHRLEEMVSRALPQRSPEQCRCIEEVVLCRGEVAQELRELIERRRIGVLVVGWKGRFVLGHARVLKELLEVVACPVLLVKPAAKPPFKLKVGEALQEHSAPEAQAQGAKRAASSPPDNS